MAQPASIPIWLILLQTIAAMHQGPVTTYTHPRGWFSLDLPEGWSVAAQTDDTLAINPGLTAANTLDAIVVVTYGELDPAQARMDLIALFDRVRPSVLQDLRSQGIEVVDDRSTPQRVALAHASGLVQRWKGRAATRDVEVWIGGLVEAGYHLTVTAVVVAGQEQRFLPGVRRMLHSVTPRPPQHNPAAERELAGAQFSAIDTRPGGSSGSFSSMLEFKAGNQVKKTLILSGRLGLSGVGGSSEEWGTYEVVGDEVRLSFKEGTDTLVFTVEQGRITTLQREGRSYRRR